MTNSDQSLPNLRSQRRPGWLAGWTALTSFKCQMRPRALWLGSQDGETAARAGLLELFFTSGMLITFRLCAPVTDIRIRGGVCLLSARLEELLESELELDIVKSSKL